MKQEGVLEHDRDRMPQVGQREIADVDAVDGDGALVHVVEAHQQASERRLAATGGADDGNRSARGYVQIEVAEHLVVLVVPEADVAERHLADAFPGGQGYRGVCIAHRGDSGEHLVDAQQCSRSTLTERDRHAQVAQREDEQPDVLHELEHLTAGHLPVQNSVTTDGEHRDEAEVRQQIERRQERAAYSRRLQRHGANVVGLHAQACCGDTFCAEALDDAHPADRFFHDGGELCLLGLHRQHRWVDPARKPGRKDVQERQRRERDEGEQGLLYGEHDHDREHHHQVRCGDRNHHHEALDLQQVAGRPAHQLTGLGVVVIRDVQMQDVREELLAQLGLGEPALAEREPPTPGSEDAGDHGHGADEQRPEPQRAGTEDGPVDGEAGQLGNRHLARTPQQTDDDSGDQPCALLAQHGAQESPPTGAGCLRVLRPGPFPHVSGHYAGRCRIAELNTRFEGGNSMAPHSRARQTPCRCR